MGVSFGTLEVEPLSFGSTELSSIHLGDTLIWEKYVPEVNYIFRNIDANGNLTYATGALEDGSGITNVGDYGLYYAFYNCSGLTGSVDLSNLTTIGKYGLVYAFRDCSGLTSINLSSLTTIGTYGLQNAFRVCTGLTSINLSSLTTIGTQGLNYAFYGCTGLTSLNLSSLTTIGTQGLVYAFRECTNIEHIYFNSLKTTSFADVKAFNNMMHSTGKTKTHTLHFPSNTETTIQGLTGYPLFGGTSGYVVLSFDLPATS